MQPDRIREKLGRSLFAGRILFRRSLDSTNALAGDLAAGGAPEGACVLAEEQTGGRGRRGRIWLSPAYANLYISLLLRPALEADRAFVLTMLLALAAREGVEQATGVRAGIKWPNDLYVEGKKLAGILTELTAKGKDVEYVILGLGLNVNWAPGRMGDLDRPATSILAETGVPADRGDLLVRILTLFEDSYLRLKAGEVDPFYRQWNEHCLVLGREVEIESQGEKICGTALRIDRDGALILRDPQGGEQRILHGDVSLRYEGTGGKGTAS